ncbi:hypothetical protein SAMN04487996_12286 [Dyadobacter soli]|uniref:Uncharacterized protein n=1 Tax=Dyadobacter soli TaxID=659014 RepID=A0A1G7WN01_9BACT|nr:hypothetical protein [Dyadobacter soli]SDG72600.1 hypothetical protein SAMN04487996_12286 [Dyadobacter soli]
MELIIKVTRGYLAVILLLAAVLTIPIIVAMVYYLMLLFSLFIGSVFFP